MPFPQIVGYAGLGSMGAGMAKALLSQGFPLRVYDIYEPSLSKVAAFSLLATPCRSPQSLVEGCDVVCLNVVSQQQIEDFFFAKGAAENLKKDAVIVIFSTVDPSWVENFARQITALERGVLVVDSPVSGGSARAAAGTLSIMAASTAQGIDRALPVLKSVSQSPGKLHSFDTGCGDGSRYKMVHQGVAICYVSGISEVLTFAATLGLSAKQVRSVIMRNSGSNWILENRGARLIEPSLGVEAALAILHKDTTILTTTARRASLPIPLTSIAQQMFLAGKLAGFSALDDSAIAKVYELLGATSAVAMSGDEGADENVEIREGAEGASGKMWLLNELMTAISIVASIECLALTKRLGMDTFKAVDIISGAAGRSASFITYAPLVLTEDYKALSPSTTVSAYVRSLDLVLEEAKKISFPLFLGTCAYEVLLRGENAGWGVESPAALIKLWS